MFYLYSYSIFLVFVVCCIVNGQSLSPFDVRIDQHKVDTNPDLVINTPRPRFSWKIRVLDHSFARNVQQEAYQMQLQSIKLTQREKPFEWDSERVLSSQSIHVPYAGSSDLLPSTYYRFRVRVWLTDSIKPSAWTEWIGFRTPIFKLHQYFTENTTAIWIGSQKINMNELRKEFVLPNTSPIESAIVYISGIGYYEFYLNGNRVDPSRKLDPGWTTYEYRTLLASFDVTANLTMGANAVGVKLGNGWYSAEQLNRPGFDFVGPPIVGPPRLIFTLTITFENGERMEVVSDQTWTGREGSIKHDSVYNGEIYDSRSDRPNWARAGFNDSLSAWITAESMPSPVNHSVNGSLVLQDMPPIRAGLDALHFEVPRDSLRQSYLTDEDIAGLQGGRLTDGAVLKPVAMWTSDSGVRVFDLGQNIAGWCRLKFRGPSGFGVYIRYGEVLTEPLLSNNRSTRNIYTENLRQALASDTYILRGDPVSEIYEPTFTTHGFRYVSVFGSPNSLSMDDIECPFVHSETTLKGHFVTSNPVVNQIQHNIQWGQLSNIMSLPTDCPQRDERHGYLGDAALAVDEALYNFDLIKFFRNFLNLIVDVQKSNGDVPDFVPGNIYDIDPNWGTALATISWQIYRHYNDLQTLADYYAPTVAYVNYLQSSYNTTGLANLTSRYGDWVPPPPHRMTNVHLTTSFGFLHDVYTLINISQILGKTEEANMYSAWYQKLAEEFHRVFYNNSSNCYADGLQAAQVFALALPGVVPANVREAVVSCLVANINENGNHLTTGIVSTAQLFPVLSDNGHHDLALDMISSVTYPSYGYMFNNPYENATTLWELWNTPLAGPGMNSRNHIMFGSVGAWFYSHLAGIDLSSERITIRPRMASESKKHLMRKLDCQLSSLHGLIHVSYTRDQHDTVSNSVLLRVSIPPNTQARIIFEPLFTGGKCQTLIENGKMIWSSDIGNTSTEQFEIEEDSITNWMTVHIGSGEYEFQALWQ